ncbi:MAG TPA: ribosome assembly RNA-binding protein YhbY [Kofleriaceae bacterium]|nr:ribosome assembly RNA-binding protein YhbY [Kofleriaceae bacterium]
MLTGKQRRHLRALAHDMKPIVQIGKGGIDGGLISALDQALSDHELVKVKVGENAGVDRHEAAENLATATKSQVAQVLGNMLLLYRPDPDDPQIELPRAKAAAGAAASTDADDAEADADDDDDDDDDDE